MDIPPEPVASVPQLNVLEALLYSNFCVAPEQDDNPAPKSVPTLSDPPRLVAPTRVIDIRSEFAV